MEDSLNQINWLHEINWVDICLTLALIGCLLVGIGMGFYRLLAIGASLLVGLFVAGSFSADLAATDFFVNLHAEFGQSGAQALAYGLLLAGCLTVGLLVVLIFRNFFGKTLKVVDGLLGGVLGVAVGCAAFGLFSLGLFQLETSRFHDPIRQSYLGSTLSEAALVGSHLFPDELQARVEASIRARFPERAETPPEPATGR